MQSIPRLTRYLLALSLLGVMQFGHAEVDEGMAAAIGSIWDIERPSFSVLGSNLAGKVSKAGTAYRADVKHSPTYLVSGQEAASVLVGRKRFNAIATRWGNFPQLATEKTRLLEASLPKKRYLLLAGPGRGLFSVGDWQRYTLLHVIDLSKPAAPVYYPLFSDAYLGERVLGRLPGSSALNYARLVPSSRGPGGATDAYEVTLYALGHKGIERVIKDGRPLSYSLNREDGAWVIHNLDSTPATNERDEEKRPFVAAVRPSLFVKVAPVAEASDKE